MSLDIDDRAVMQKTVEHRCDEYGVVEQLRPIAERFIRSDDGTGPFVARGHELVEQVAFLARHGCVADFIDHHQCRPEVAAHP